MVAIREEARSDATREEECSDAIHKQAACLDALREEVCRDDDQTHLDAIREEARSGATREEECSDAIHKQARSNAILVEALNAIREGEC